MASQVNNYLFAEDLDQPQDHLDVRVQEQIKLVLPHVTKWADDSMKRDKDLCELIVQTLRMEYILQSYEEGSKEFFSSDKGKRIRNLLSLYGKNVIDSPDPKSYKKLVDKWLLVFGDPDSF